MWSNIHSFQCHNFLEIETKQFKNGKSFRCSSHHRKLSLKDAAAYFTMRWRGYSAKVSFVYFSSSVKGKTSFMLVHQKIQLSSNSVEHNHISHQLKKGNHDLLHYLNWILFLTVMLWLSGIMIFVVSSNQQGKNTGWLKSKFEMSFGNNSETKTRLRGVHFFYFQLFVCNF